MTRSVSMRWDSAASSRSHCSWASIAASRAASSRASSASWAAYTQYAASLAPDDDKEPLKLDKVSTAPPATDSDEPMDL